MRYHNFSDGSSVPFTLDEEVAWDAKEASALAKEAAIQLQYQIEVLKSNREESIQSDLNGFQMRNPDDIVNIQQTIDGLKAMPAAKAAGLIPQEYPETVNFRKADNTFQTMTLQDMETLYLQYLLRKQQAWAEFKTAVDALG